MPLSTYLEIVDSIHQDLNGPNNQEIIYTLHQTQISSMITRIVKETYYHIIDGKDWPQLYEMFQLTQTGASTPTHMTVPSDVMDFQYVKYNVIKSGETKAKFIDMKFLEPKEFMDLVDVRDSSATNIDVVSDTSGIPLNIFNDKAPQYWTSFDDSVVVLDAYDSAVDTTNLLTTKTQCRGKVYPTVTESNTFVFDLPVDAFSYLLAEAKTTCFALIAKEGNPKAEQMANTQRRRMSQQAWKNSEGMGIKYPNYGRVPKK